MRFIYARLKDNNNNNKNKAYILIILKCFY